MSTSEAATVSTGSVARTVPSGAFVERDGELFYRIVDHDAMPPFFMSIVSSSDHYLFVSSNGGLTAGRKDPDHALFPYYTDDRTHDSHEHTGSKTILRVHGNQTFELWEPFSDRGANCIKDSSERIVRNLYKSVYSTKVVFEEINYHLGLTFSYEWATSDRFGFVRTCRLINLKPSLQTVEVLDGLQNLLPCGITRRFQLEYSTLVDGYKRTELNSECGLAIIQLTSVPVDRPEPSESLFCNVAWSTGFEHPVHLLSSVQLDDFRNGGELTEETDIHGRRGAYFVNNSFELPAYGEREWKVVADVNKDTAGVRSLLHTLKHDLHLSRSVCDDVATTSQNLVRMVASADGLQQTRDQASTWHHFASTLFNIMRGGIPDDHYVIKRDDFAEFLNEINREVAKEHSAFVASLPVRLQHDRLLQLVHETSDLDFERIAHEYLPLTFSRRHGDPSRPWNIFDIRVKDER
jgi:hypothetical protein